MRFEALLLEKKASGSASDKSDRDLIQEAIARYNDHQANSAIKRWQLNADVTTAIIGVVCGMSAECRQIVNERSQAVHFRKYNYWWATNCRRMKKSMRSRLRWNEETWTKNDCGFDSVDTEKVHHIGFCDLSKWGRLSVPEVDEVASWALRTLNQNPEYSNLDKEVALDLMKELQQEVYLGFYSETSNPTLAQYVVEQVKDKLIEEWKAGQGLMGQQQQKFQASADLSEYSKPREPVLKLCTMSNGHLALPKDVVWEETTAKGVSDSSPMTLYELLFTIEKRGTLQYTITGHKAERPPAVQRGEETDRWDWKL
ncbi:Uncharacterized protein SCF082_LOCUS49592 [Durusdinium trenchii]|uniref:Uncharacterized protein n=1 Tax=Durusdinium trenchii TaxID=1381693 RepID=A0ABP0S2B7_9DINO